MKDKSATLPAIACVVISIFCLPALVTAGDSCGTVYVASTIDTEAKPPASLGVYADTLDLACFAPRGFVDTVMSVSGRGSYRDSYGGAPKYTWMLLNDEYYCHSAIGDCNVVFSAMESHFPQANFWGDIFGWHYHNIDWCDLDGDSVAYWNQLVTFDGTPYNHGTDIELAEKMLASLVVDRGFYPGVFRSGWVWEDNDLSRWLDDIVPFDFSNIAPLQRSRSRIDSLDNIYDWSSAPTGWKFYHPDSLNYQLPGGMKRTIFRTSDYSWDFNTAFIEADSGRDQFLVTFAHSYYGTANLDFGPKLSSLQSLFPCVKVRFVTALEGARFMLGLTDSLPPVISIAQERDTFNVFSDKPLFSFPFGALKAADGRYTRVIPTSLTPDIVSGNYRWTFDLSTQTKLVRPAVFAVGGTTPAGATFVSAKYTVRDWITGLSDASQTQLPVTLTLFQNYPNPFNSETQINFDLSTPSNVRLSVLNALGRKVRVLVDAPLGVGRHTVLWDGTDDRGHATASGIYLCRIEAAGYASSRKMILLK